MTDQTAYPAAGSADRGLAAGAALPRAGRRITAESFRALTARLKPAEAAPAAMPAIVPPEPWADAPCAPPVAVSAPVVADETPAPQTQPDADLAFAELPDFGLPAFTPLTPHALPDSPDAPPPEAPEIASPQPFAYDHPPMVELEPFRPDSFWEPLDGTMAEPVAAIASVAMPAAEERSSDVDAAATPAAEPLPPEVDAAAETVAIAEADFGPAGTMAEAAPDEAALAEVSPATVPEFDLPSFVPSPTEDAVADDGPVEPVLVDSVAAATEEPAAISETPPAEPAAVAPEAAPAASSPLVDRVVEAMLKTVTDAIYAKPSASERAAFLRDIATLLETEGAEDVQPAAPAVEREPVEAPAIDAALPEPAQADAPAAEPASILSETLVDRLGPTSALLRKSADAPDPFARTAQNAIRLDPKPRETLDADENSGELALSLLDMMSAGSASGLPQERALAADTLLRMIARVPVKQLMAVVERMAIMESPPSLLVAKLIRDPRAEVIGPLLERCTNITDQDLINASVEGDSAKRRMIARRRVISPVLSDHLIAIADNSVLLTLIRNPGAGFSHDAFFKLAEQASRNPALLAPLCTRADLPAPVAFELFWFVPPELRRFILSRFLTDSETLHRILKITLATQEGAEHKFPSRESLDEALDFAVVGKLEQAAQALARIAGVAPDTALRIFADKDGEPLTVLLKALGYPRGKFEESMNRLKNSDYQLLEAARNIAELQSIFDMLSFNKARILLTYWDWFVLKSGPYAPHN